MTITAKIIADSISPAGKRLTTLELRYPRFIHAEFMTHRVFSRNASSSRAVPVAKLIEDVMRDPAMPVWWGKNQKGMQAREELLPDYRRAAQEQWLLACKDAASRADKLQLLGTHKQIVNRLLEPFSHITVIISATEWKNFFALRCHPDAQPEMQALAEAMRDAMAASTPAELAPGEWHLPYVTSDDWLGSYGGDYDVPLLRKLSVARCARVSYLTHEGARSTIEDDLALYDRLLASRHMSPFEHQATPDEWVEDWAIQFGPDVAWRYRGQHGNFVGWSQNRKIIEPALQSTATEHIASMLEELVDRKEAGNV